MYKQSLEYLCKLKSKSYCGCSTRSRKLIVQFNLISQQQQEAPTTRIQDHTKKQHLLWPHLVVANWCAHGRVATARQTCGV